jgi:hypothetical protein
MKLPAIFKTVVICLLLVFGGLTLALLYDAARLGLTPQNVLVEEFRGAAYEDIFGFGFWPTWGVVAFTQFTCLLLAWLLLGARGVRGLVPVLLVAFVAASVLDYFASQRQYSLWSAYVSHNAS